MYANNSPSELGAPDGYVQRRGRRAIGHAPLEGALPGRWMHIAVTFGRPVAPDVLNGLLHRTVTATGNVPVDDGRVDARRQSGLAGRVLQRR